MKSTDEIRFAEWQMWPQLRILLHRGKPVKISARAFDVLVVLVSAQGQVVSKDRLLTQVWGNEIVEENNLQAQISAIRRVLGNDRHLLTTEFGAGYRFDLLPSHQVVSPKLSRNPPVVFPFLTSILGRDQAVQEVCALIRQHPLVTITGLGGVGKTRLAWEVVNLVRTKYPDGVCVVELAHISDATSLLSAFSQALHLPLTAVHNGYDLSHQLAQRQCLLMIDNGEHVIKELKPVIALLLNAAPHIAMLLTSQAATEIAGEQQYLLPPLVVPEKEEADFQRLLQFPCVRLFIERAQTQRFDYHPSNAELPVIGELCRHLDGLPLAIELAASRLPIMSVSEIYHCLEDRFQLLSNRQSVRVSRHQKIKTTLEWTYQLLNPREQKLFCSLGIFTDMFTVNVVTDLLQTPEEHSWQIVDDLQRLVSLSLIQVITQVPVTRFRLLETLRQFACDKLRLQGVYPMLAAQFADYCHRQAEQAQLDWYRLPTKQWRAHYDCVLNDLRSVLQHTLTEGSNPAKGLDILQSMTPFWIEYSLYHECQRHIYPQLNEVRLQGVLTLHQRMNLSAAAGKASTWAKGPTPETRFTWQTALSLAEQLDDNEIRLQAYYGLWLYYLRTGKLDLSLHHAQSMCSLARAINDTNALATGLRIVGVSWHFLGQHALGRDYLQQSLDRFAIDGSEHAFRFGLDQQTAGEAFLSRVLWVQGEYKTAKQIAWRAVKKAARLQHICSLCCALAEGACMTAALDRNPRWVRKAALWLIELAEKHDLYFWKTYGELFLHWAEQFSHSNIQQTMLFRSLRGMGLDWQYSPLLSEMDSKLSQQTPYENWCTPELMRLSAIHLPICAQRQQLELALNKAYQQQAYGWALRIVCSLATLLVESGDRVMAKQLITEVLNHIDDSQHSTDIRNALELCTRLGG
ncbi:winged helix-turn-helix domain-containing protein [Providencia vermicola]|uniref:winged helix-turn-helix domain-containing protein n=1 Tax=Providencia vermicola TaxID=333965 RepID=UPI0032DA3E82